MGFKAKDHKDEGGDFSNPIPPSKYEVVLAKWEKKDSTTEGNKYLNCTFKVVNNKEYKGRVIFHMFNLKNSEQAQAISEGQLASLMRCCGVEELNDKWNPVELDNLPAMAQVGIEKNSEHGDKNRISRFLPDENPAASGKIDDEPWADKGKKKKKDKKKKGKKKKSKK